MAVTVYEKSSTYGRILGPLAKCLFKFLMGRGEVSPYRMRRLLDAVGKISVPLSGVRYSFADIADVRSLYILPDNISDDSPLMVYLHGGAFISGSISSHKNLAGRICKSANVRCLIIDYPLAPEHPFPAALSSVLGVWEELLKKGEDSRRIVFVGDSAGGGLALSSILLFKDRGVATPSGLYCISPFCDLTLTSESIIRNQHREVVLSNPNALPGAVRMYSGNRDVRDSLISPMFGRFENFPKTLVHVGSDEILLNDSIGLHDKMLKTGGHCSLKIWKGMWHVWPLFDQFGLREAKEALADAALFINECVS